MDGELSFWDMDFFCSSVMELGNSKGNFRIVDLGLDKQKGVIASSTAR